MSKSSAHLEFLPQQARQQLLLLGENLTIARKRRRESLRTWAARLGISVRTVQRMEAGDPGVGVGIYVSALWVIGRAGALPSLADPALDLGALQMSIREASQRGLAKGAKNNDD
jgi:transcriptional regulator with XRE-family HTH domain